MKVESSSTTTTTTNIVDASAVPNSEVSVLHVGVGVHVRSVCVFVCLCVYMHAALLWGTNPFPGKICPASTVPINFVHSHSRLSG